MAPACGRLRKLIQHVPDFSRSAPARDGLAERWDGIGRGDGKSLGGGVDNLARVPRSDPLLTQNESYSAEMEVQRQIADHESVVGA